MLRIICRRCWLGLKWWEVVRSWIDFEDKYDRLNVEMWEEEKSRFLAYAIRKMEILVPEMGKTIGGSGLGRNIRSSILDILEMRCLRDVQLAPWIFRSGVKRKQVENINLAVTGRMIVLTAILIDKVIWGSNVNNTENIVWELIPRVRKHLKPRRLGESCKARSKERKPGKCSILEAKEKRILCPPWR